jgi:hypothetical protein
MQAWKRQIHKLVLSEALILYIKVSVPLVRYNRATGTAKVSDPISKMVRLLQQKVTVTELITGENVSILCIQGKITRRGHYLLVVRKVSLVGGELVKCFRKGLTTDTNKFNTTTFSQRLLRIFLVRHI